MVCGKATNPTNTEIMHQLGEVLTHQVGPFGTHFGGGLLGTILAYFPPKFSLKTKFGAIFELA